jgi:hypothetical protein
MGYDLTIQGLLRKRGELAGQVEATRAHLTAMMTDLQNIDAALRVFRPDIELDELPEGTVPAPLTGFRGEIQRFLLDELRKANGPQSTFDLADKIMAKRGVDPNDRIHATLVRKRTGYALAKLRKAGKVTSMQSHRATPLEWTLVFQSQ